MVAEQKNIKVVVRVRPYNKRELEQNQRCIVKVMDKTTLLFDPDEEDDEFFFQGTKINYRDITKRMHKKLSMEYDRVFDIDTKNQEVFEECTAPLVDSVLNGYNCSVFVYGATGAGKTFTMLGSDTCRGITYLTMKDLFEKIDRQSVERKFDVGVSYVEVYNEQVMNLLTKSGPMKLREDSNGVVISGLVLKPIYSADELLHLLAQGNNNRTQHPTDANAESSRSHAIFQVHIRMTEKKTGTKRTVKLSMIDLAGSERAASTKGIGVRFKEGASINKSLLALGNCINKLADGLKHIPYRDSNLTRILKDSLGGNCQTLMVANVSMSSLTYEDTYNTLKYASRAKKIRTTLRQNVLKSNMPKEFYMKKVNELMEENERTKMLNKTLEAKLAQQQKESAAYGARGGYDENELKMWISKIDVFYSMVIKTQEYVYSMQSKEKILKFRTKLKEDAETCKKLVTLDKAAAQEDIAEFTASVTRFGKQIEKQQEDLLRWRKKLQDAHKDLDKLKREIKESKFNEILMSYQKAKDLEIQYSKQNIRLDHMARINLLLLDSEKLRKALMISCETLKRIYDSKSPTDSTFDTLHAELDSAFERMRTILCGYGGKLQSDKLDDIDFHMDQEVEIQLNGKRLHASDDADDDDDDDDDKDGATRTTTLRVRRQRNKRLHYGTEDSEWDLDMMDDTDSDGCHAINASKFKEPKALRFALANPNETQVLATDDDYNTSFDVIAASPASNLHLTASTRSANKATKRNDLVANILSEQIVRVNPNNKSHQLKNVLLKSNISRQGILKTVASGVQKENKKYSPSRVRKSPRSVVSKAFASTANLVRKHSTRINNSAEPIVRINRAASFRVKK